jgi:hypothetical protein
MGFRCFFDWAGLDQCTSWWWQFNPLDVDDIVFLDMLSDRFYQKKPSD